MPIAFSCPSCAKEYNVPDDYADRQVACKQCGTHMLVPSLSIAEGETEETQWQRMVADVEASSPILQPRSTEHPAEKAAPSRKIDEEAYTADGMRVFTGPRKFEMIDYPGVDWLDDFMPPMLIFFGMAVPFVLGIVNVFNQSEAWGRLIGTQLIVWLAFLSCVVPITLSGAALAGKLLKFPLPETPYKRMLASCCVPSSLAVILGFFMGDYGALFGFLGGLFLAIPVFWMLFHLRPGEAVVSLLFCFVFGIGSFFAATYSIGVAVGYFWPSDEQQQQTASSPSRTAPRDGRSPSRAPTGTPPPRELVPGVRADERGGVADKPRSVDQWNQLKRTFSGAAVDAAKRFGQPLPPLVPPAAIFQPPPSSSADFDPNWTGLSHLDDPVTIRSWYIRPPTDLTLDVGRVRDDADHVSVVWRGADRELRFEMFPRVRMDQHRAWVVEPTDTTIAPRDADLLQWQSRGSPTFDVGRIAGRPWMRYAWRDDRLQHAAYVRTPDAVYRIVCDEPLHLGGEPREHVMYLMADGDRWVRVQMQWLSATRDVGQTLEAAARTARPLAENETENVRALLGPAGLITLDDAQWRRAISTLFARDPVASETEARELLFSQDPAIRARALDLLEHFGTDNSASDLRQIVAGEDVPAARRALTLLKRVKPGEISLMDQLVYDMKWSMPEGDMTTLRTLSQVSPPADAAQRKTIADMLTRIVRSSQGLSQRYAIEALGKWGDQSHIDVLTPLLDQEGIGTTTVVPAIGKLGGEKAAQVLVEHWARPEVSFVSYSHYIAAISAIGPSAEDHVLRLLRAPDMRLREAAIRTLESVGTRKSVTALVRLIREDESVADVSRDAVRAIQDRLRQR